MNIGCRPRCRVTPCAAVVRRASVLGLALIACDTDAGTNSCGPITAVVARVIDGDTVELDGGERVRYLLIDSPESTTEVECYGFEAAQYNRSLVEGQAVVLTYDEECTDRFGRLLAYVSMQGRDVNRLMIERGFACTLYIPSNGADRIDDYESVEAVARAQAVGMWGACEEVGCG